MGKRLTESDIARATNRTLKRLLREYDEDKFPDWWRKEPKNNITDLNELIDYFSEKIAAVRDEDDAFEIVRDLGRVNATALKKHPSLPRNVKPRDLPDEEYRYNKTVYAIKDVILPMLVDLYNRNGWDISADISQAPEGKGIAVYFRNGSSGVQNSFHGYKG